MSPAGMEWRLTLADGRALSNLEAYWPELCERFTYHGWNYWMVRSNVAAVELAAYAGNRLHRVRHANDPQARFIREWRGRTRLNGEPMDEPVIMHHAIGYYSPTRGLYMLEIDPSGNTTLRSGPPLAPPLGRDDTAD